MHLTKSEVEAIANEAAKKAVRDTFLVLGTDIADAKDLLALQNRLRFLSSLESTSTAAVKQSIISIFVIAAGAIAALIWTRVGGGGN